MGRIATILARRRARLTNQQIADLALQADQSRREAIKIGDYAQAMAYAQEVERLTAQMGS